MAKSTNLNVDSISAKVSNYKSMAGVNNSSNTIEIYHKYGHLSIQDIKEVIG